MNYAEFQHQHRAWLNKEFPNQMAWMPAVGMVEEAGELMHAVLKLEQERKYGAEPRYKGKDWYSQVRDAVGDCAIFACSLSNTMSWDYSGIVSSAHAECISGRTLLSICVELVQAACNVVVDPTSDSYLVSYLSKLRTVANAMSADFGECVAEAWAKVRLRCRK